jgi:hypothetical protein
MEKRVYCCRTVLLKYTLDVYVRGGNTEKTCEYHKFGVFFLVFFFFKLKSAKLEFHSIQDYLIKLFLWIRAIHRAYGVPYGTKESSKPYIKDLKTNNEIDNYKIYEIDKWIKRDPIIQKPIKLSILSVKCDPVLTVTKRGFQWDGWEGNDAPLFINSFLSIHR